jgi:hypothetical protein
VTAGATLEVAFCRTETAVGENCRKTAVSKCIYLT